jgi:hypothetical protein
MLNNQYADLLKIADIYGVKYQENKPFPNIYFDDFFET